MERTGIKILSPFEDLLYSSNNFLLISFMLLTSVLEFCYSKLKTWNKGLGL